MLPHFDIQMWHMIHTLPFVVIIFLLYWVSFHISVFSFSPSSNFLWSSRIANKQLSRLFCPAMAVPSGRPRQVYGRQTTAFPNTCGYEDGDKTRPRTAAAGFNCRTDDRNMLWGFCPTSMVALEDCNLAAACVDTHSCASGCGRIGRSGIATISWYVNNLLLWLQRSSPLASNSPF